MSGDPRPVEPPLPPAIEGPSTLAAALRWGCETAVAEDARRIVCVDGDFASWPLDDAAILDRLTRWLKRPQRRLVLLARHYDAVPRLHPRFTAWRRDWSHAVDCRRLPEDLGAAADCLLVSDGAVCVRVVDPVSVRGRAMVDARRARVALAEIDAILQRSECAFAPDLLGL